MKPTKFHAGLIIFVFFVMMGCGSSSHKSPEINDLTAPSYTTRTPQDNTTNVPIDTAVSVYFSEIMDDTTINDSTFFITDEENQDIDGTISFDGSAYMFTPDPALTCGVTYTVTITTDVQDSSGNSLEDEIVWSFTTINKPGYTTPLTLDASILSDTSAELKGSFSNPDTYTTTAYFEYGLDESYGNLTQKESYATTSEIPYAQTISNLRDRTVYHYRIVTDNNDGTFYGDDMTFITCKTPTVITSNLSYPIDLHLSDNELFWLDVENETIGKINISGENQETVTETDPLEYNVFFEMNDTDFYWGDSQSIWTTSVDDITIYPFAEEITAKETIYQARLYLNFLYVHTEYGIKQVSLSDGSINSISFSNSDRYDCLQVDSDGIYLLYKGDSDDPFNDDSDGRIFKFNFNGSSPITLAMDLNKPGKLTLYDGQLFWVETGFQKLSSKRGAIKCVSVSGGEVTVLAEDLTPRCLAVDQSTLYYAFIGVLYKMNLLTGETNALTNYHTPTKPIIGTNYIYWIESNNSYPKIGTIYKCSKIL